MYTFKDIKAVQVEISSYCNAACPQCPRNFFGGNTMPDLPLHKWSVTDFKHIFSPEFLQQLETFYFCGTYGDPMTNTKIGEMCEILRNNNPTINIGIHTNGGVGNTGLYTKLATTVDFIAFGIDGLADTNRIYRRNTNWQKIMKNVQTFIDVGGHAIWDFIVFEHNEHQVTQAEQLSKEMGFKEFCVKKTGRFLNRSHKFNDYQNVLDTKGFVEYKIKIPKNKEYVNEVYPILASLPESNLDQYLSSCEIHCNANKIKEIYIGADGFVFPCGWLHDRMYGPEIMGHKDHEMIKSLMNQIGGWQKANIFYNSLYHIVNEGWFPTIANTWHSQQRLERCAMMCGSDLNIIGSQNSSIKYKQ
jgi:MoaA/NifB/PqqE/SkfB family radical SAM enzyme